MRTKVRNARQDGWDWRQSVDEELSERNSTMQKNTNRRRYIHKNILKLVTVTDAIKKKLVGYKILGINGILQNTTVHCGLVKSVKMS